MKDNIETVYNLLKKNEPQTPSEIADQAGLNQKTVQTILFDLKDEKDDVRMKKIGPYRLFWKI
jgi:predicted transcriptional regulator